MRLAFTSRAFWSYSLPEAIAILGHLGYQGIEIMADTPHAFPTEMDDEAIGRVKSALAAQGMGIANLDATSLFALGDREHPNWIEDNEVQRGRRIQHTIDSLYLGEQLGACTVSTFAGGTLGSLSREEATSRFFEGLQQVLPHCETTGVALIIQPRPGTLIERIGQFQGLWDTFESQWLGLDLEIGHLYTAHEDPLAESANMKSFIWHVGLEDVSDSREHQHLPLGSGIVDFPRILRGLAGMGYGGYATVEVWGRNADPERLAANAMGYLRQALPAGLLDRSPVRA